jgi:hypothetical protein
VSPATSLSGRFEDLPAGDYLVSVALGDSSPPIATSRVRVTGGVEEIEVTVPRLGPAHRLEVYVAGPDGQALDEEDVYFGVLDRSESLAAGVGTRAVRRLDGSYLVALASRHARPGGARRLSAQPEAAGPVRWFLQATSKKHGRREIEFVPGTTSRLDISFR